MSGVVRVEIGWSVLEGERIAQEAAAAGLRVRLLRNQHPETGAFYALGSCALLISEDDEDDLRRLLAEYGY